MQQVYTNVSKVMIDSRSGSNLLYLPLDKLLQQAGVPAAIAPAPGPVATPSSVDPAAAQSVDIRSRADARSRDREGR
jgi:membrane protease subunit HflK